MTYGCQIVTAPLKTVDNSGDIAVIMADIGRRTKAAARVLALAPATQKDAALAAMAQAIRNTTGEILEANADDVAEAKSGGATPAFVDRLQLDAKRVAAMAEGVDVVRGLRDPVGMVMELLDATERAADRAGARSARRDRRHLREPSERHC